MDSEGKIFSSEMASADSSKEYVLQWSGHAAHVTERFSGLLARQALVDVTLICQGQKLRVHKLVLASSSLYFEEMLQQDLGQEPIILLRDLDFEVLKAMVEFMYCGETTISQCHLQTLLDAAQVFKVKQLECIVESMIKSNTIVDKNSSEPESCSPSTDTMSVAKNNQKARPSGERCDDKCLRSDLEESETLEKKSDRFVDDLEEQISPRSAEEESLGHVCLDTLDGESSIICTSEDDDEKSKSTEKQQTPCNSINSTESIENPINRNPSKNRTKAQDHAVGECSRVYTHKKRKYIDTGASNEERVDSSKGISNPDENLPKNSSISKKGEKESGKSLKVYTHKRRKSMDERRCEIFENLYDSPEEPTSTSSIDLNDDTLLNDTPINLSNGLDMETSEYIWSLSTESIQYVVGCTINSMNSLIANNEEKNKSRNEPIEKNAHHDVRSCNQKRTRQMKELFSCENGNGEMPGTPVLRRSVRINQLESDDSLNNNNGTISSAKGGEKSLDLRREDYANNVTMNLTKASKRRCTKDQSFRIIDENTVEAPCPVGKNANSRSLRSAAQMSSRKSKISRSATTREERTRNTRQNRDKPEKIDSSDILVNTRLNTIASVDRALWGDMSDFLENRDDSSEELLNYSTSREIPFAVGLLPLRAALERMQATVDHQPRKTRSSVAPWRQETTSLRKKIISHFDHSFVARKDNSHSENEDIETAVCHIQIRTSSSPNETQNPPIPTDEQIITVGTRAESNEQ